MTDSFFYIFVVPSLLMLENLFFNGLWTEWDTCFSFLLEVDRDKYERDFLGIQYMSDFHGKMLFFVRRLPLVRSNNNKNVYYCVQNVGFCSV